MNKAKRLQKWFLRYGLTGAEKLITNQYRFGREQIWYILVKAVERAYNRGYKDGLKEGKVEYRYLEIKDPTNNNSTDFFNSKN